MDLIVFVTVERFISYMRDAKIVFLM